MAEVWTEEMLDELRARGDPEADAVMRAFAASSSGGPRDTVNAVAHAAHLPDAAGSPVIAEWMAGGRELPDWADKTQIDCGQQVFHEHGLLICIALYFASLPEAYASAKGARVLWLTGALVRDTDRRINETAQFLLDVLEPGSLDGADAGGFQAIRRVRLMHAAVRWLVLHDPAWCATWGIPINQEEFLGTLLTFTTVVFDALERLGVTLTAVEAECYLSTWCVVASLLGAPRDGLPDSVSSARQLADRIRSRYQQLSAEGLALENALLSHVGGRLPRPLRGLPRALTRRCASPDALEILQLGRPEASTTERRMLETLTAVEHGSGVIRHAAEWVSTELLVGLVRAGTSGRPPFRLPQTLGQAWGVDPDANRISRVKRAARPSSRSKRATRSGPSPT
jgi:hypothetical protein